VPGFGAQIAKGCKIEEASQWTLSATAKDRGQRASLQTLHPRVVRAGKENSVPTSRKEHPWGTLDKVVSKAFAKSGVGVVVTLGFPIIPADHFKARVAVHRIGVEQVDGEVKRLAAGLHVNLAPRLELIGGLCVAAQSPVWMGIVVAVSTVDS
jgi:hypothetical protein